MALNVLGWLIFVVALLVSVMLHEAGHWFSAKRFGMKVTEFFVGFGPRVWSFFRGETEYGIKAIPAGGYCKIVGMTPLEELSEQDKPRAMIRHRGLPRLIVLCAGSFMHFVTAFVLLLIIAMGLGLADNDHPTTKVAEVSSCVPASVTAPCKGGEPESPAKRAGLRNGDRIVAFGGTKVTGWSQLSHLIKSHKPDNVAITVVRDGHRVTLHTDLARSPAKQGGSFLGMTAQVPVKRYGPVEAGKFSGQVMGRMFSTVGTVLYELPSSIPKMFGSDRGSSAGSSAGSVVGAARFSGDVVAQHVPWRVKVSELLVLVVSLNVFIGVFNMIPLLPMDGGHVAILLYERAKMRVMRVLGRPDPGPVDITKLMPVTYVVLVLLVGLGLTLVLADIVNPLQLQ